MVYRLQLSTVARREFCRRWKPKSASCWSGYSTNDRHLPSILLALPNPSCLESSIDNWKQVCGERMAYITQPAQQAPACGPGWSGAEPGDFGILTNLSPRSGRGPPEAGAGVWTFDGS